MDVIHLELKLSDSNKEMAALHTLCIYVGPLYCNLIGKIHYYYLLQYGGAGGGWGGFRTLQAGFFPSEIQGSTDGI